MTMTGLDFMREAIRLSREGSLAGKGGPFGAVVVKDGAIVGRGCNEVLATNDPTAHAEIVAIRDAAKALGSFHLTGCEIYTTCEPCPMCLGAIYWAKIEKIVYANTRADAARIGFQDEFLYEELGLPPADRKLETTQFLRKEALAVLDEWLTMESRRLY